MTARDRPRIEVIGHGGAGDFYPGNSRESIEQALKIGVDRIEIDVQRSADGDLVLVHDKAFAIHGRKTPADEITTSQFRRMLPGLLTLDDLVEINSANVPLLLDVKLPGYEDEVLEAIRRHGVEERAVLSTTFAVTARRFARLAPGLPRAIGYPRDRLGVSNLHWPRPVQRVGAMAL
ncbi:MAG: glycerophosphoryl diester phosphodiesterase, partial [Thermomicrobiales bacterium]|nr:glycerophosphoryl diester phosphodiesterase [Thermomicrobiales bacterium]